jgi:hypothetical protein
MRHSRVVRLVAALAAAVFFAGESGVQVLDALLYHRGGAPTAVAVPHVESGSTTNNHADHCMLAFRLANGRVSPAIGVAIRIDANAVGRAAPRPAAAPHRVYPGRHQQSRAPPAPLA